MSLSRHTYPNPAAAANACVDLLVDLAGDAIRTRGRATVAVSGGSTPRLLFQRMAEIEFDWSAVHFFWVDERAVPPDNEISNYRLAETYFLKPARIDPENIHRMRGEMNSEAAAADYERELRSFFSLAEGQAPRFDIVQQGMGPDGHTASLFPGDSAIHDRQHLVRAVYVPKFDQWRITLMPATLLAANANAFLVAGDDKAAAVRGVFHDPLDPDRLPAQLITREAQQVSWFLDSAAARLLED